MVEYLKASQELDFFVPDSVDIKKAEELIKAGELY